MADEELVTLKIDGDDTGFVKVTKEVADELSRLEKEAKKAKTELERLARNEALVNQFKDLSVEVSKAVDRSADLKVEVNNLKKTIKDSGEATDEQTKELERLTFQYNEARKEARLYSKQLSNVNRELKRENINVKEVDVSLEKLNNKQSKLNSTLSKTTKEYSDLISQQKRYSKSVPDFAKKTPEVDAFGKSIRRLSQAYIALMAAQEGTEAIQANVDAFSDFEKALTGVEKTSETLSRNQLAELGDEITRLGVEITPTTTTELLKFAEVAGQLGVRGSEALLRFVKVADMLEVSTDLAGDAAVKSLARIIEISTTTEENVSNLASSLISLGNNAKLSESELLHFANDVMTRIGSTTNVSAESVLGLSTALKQVGLPAERTGSALQRVFLAINNAVKSGGEQMELFTRITGESAEALREGFAEEGVDTLVKFTEGLKRAVDEGGTVQGVLRAVGITSNETIGVFETMVNQLDNVNKFIALSTDEFEKNTAAMKEASKFYSTQDAELKRLENRYIALKVAVGETWSDETQDAIEAFDRLLVDNKQTILGIADAAGLAVNSFTDLLSSINDIGGSALPFNPLEKALQAISASLSSASGTISRIGRDLNRLILLFQKVLDKFTPLDMAKAIEETEARIKASTDRMNESFQKMAGSAKAFFGQSSDAFEDLKINVSKYSEAVKLLSEEDKKLLDNIITSNEYNEDLNDTYRRLTSAITRARREVALNNAQADITHDKDTKAIEDKGNLTKVVTKLNEATEESKSVVDRISTAMRDQDTVTANLLKTDEARSIQLDAINTALVVNAEQLNKHGVELGKINTEYASGAISSEEYASKMEILTIKTNFLKNEQSQLLVEYQSLFSASENLIESQGSLAISMGNSSSQAISLQNSVRGLELKIEKYNKQLENTNLLESERIRITKALIIANDELKQTKQNLKTISELERMTVSQVNEKYKILTREMKKLEDRYKSNKITVGQYRSEKEKLVKQLALITKYTNDNTDATDKNTESIINNTEATLSNVEAHRQRIKTQRELNDELAKTPQIFEPFDATGKQLSEITEEIARLEAAILENSRNKTSVNRDQLQLMNEQLTLQLRALEAEKQRLLSLQQSPQVAQNLKSVEGSTGSVSPTLPKTPTPTVNRIVIGDEELDITTIYSESSKNLENVVNRLLKLREARS